MVAQLLETIEKNGEFERYVVMLNERAEREHRNMRKNLKERLRLVQGDDYVSDEESDYDKEQDDDDYDDETDSEYDSEVQSVSASKAAANARV